MVRVLPQSQLRFHGQLGAFALLSNYVARHFSDCDVCLD